MAFSNIFFEIIIKLIIAVAFVMINALLIREIVTAFGVRDKSISTATAMSIWVGAVWLLTSFMGDIVALGLVLAVFVYLFFIYLFKKYYILDWRESIIIWECWLTVLLYLVILFTSVSQSIYQFIVWGFIPLVMNLSFVITMKLNLHKKWVNVVSIMIGFLVINLIWIFLFKKYLPI